MRFYRKNSGRVKGRVSDTVINNVRYSTGSYVLNINSALGVILGYKRH